MKSDQEYNYTDGQKILFKFFKFIIFCYSSFNDLLRPLFPSETESYGHSDERKFLIKSIFLNSIILSFLTVVFVFGWLALLGITLQLHFELLGYLAIYSFFPIFIELIYLFFMFGSAIVLDTKKFYDLMPQSPKRLFSMLSLGINAIGFTLTFPILSLIILILSPNWQGILMFFLFFLVSLSFVYLSIEMFFKPFLHFKNKNETEEDESSVIISIFANLIVFFFIFMFISLFIRLMAS